ncbi:hypothetical protein M405DRAFT_826523 [Rhizopogon salebrosus TDB-379]|nr:hypothetical protein M405DRAFT_826523 [Rhizopogon salebrosus TDB-379]
MHEIQQFPPLAIVPSFEPQPESAPGALKDKGSAPSTCDLKPRQKCVRVLPKVSETCARYVGLSRPSPVVRRTSFPTTLIPC